MYSIVFCVCLLINHAQNCTFNNFISLLTTQNTHELKGLLPWVRSWPYLPLSPFLTSWVIAQERLGSLSLYLLSAYPFTPTSPRHMTCSNSSSTKPTLTIRFQMQMTFTESTHQLSHLHHKGFMMLLPVISCIVWSSSDDFFKKKKYPLP